LSSFLILHLSLVSRNFRFVILVLVFP
jgi:hypothetical protein